MTRLRPARAFMPHPTAEDPVKVRSLKRVVRDEPVPECAFHRQRRSPRPSGTPASTRRRPSISALSGVLVAGLSTMGLPAAMAGASLCAARLSGKLKGEMAATGPSGHPPRDRHPTLAVGREIHRQPLARRAGGPPPRPPRRSSRRGRPRCARRAAACRPRRPASAPRPPFRPPGPAPRRAGCRRAGARAAQPWRPRTRRRHPRPLRTRPRRRARWRRPPRRRMARRRRAAGRCRRASNRR